MDVGEGLVKYREENVEKQRRFRDAEGERLKQCSADEAIKHRQKNTERKQQY